jgi:hypothetical protein
MEALTAVSYIKDTLSVTKRNDEENYNGNYHTKSVILEIYDAIQGSICTDQPNQTRLNPPPANPRYCHLPRPS